MLRLAVRRGGSGLRWIMWWVVTVRVALCVAVYTDTSGWDRHGIVVSWCRMSFMMDSRSMDGTAGITWLIMTIGV